MVETLANQLLRSYPSSTGNILVHCWGYRTDAELLSVEALAQCADHTNWEGAQRPAKRLSKLAGSMESMAKVVLFALGDLGKTGLLTFAKWEPQLLESLQLLGPNGGPTSGEELREALVKVLTFVGDPNKVEALQRSALLGANLYVSSMQMLQARLQPVFFCQAFTHLSCLPRLFIYSHLCNYTHDHGICLPHIDTNWSCLYSLILSSQITYRRKFQS